MSILQNELLAALRARCKARMPIFDFRSGGPKQLIGNRDMAKLPAGLFKQLIVIAGIHQIGEVGRLVTGQLDQ